MQAEKNEKKSGKKQLAPQETHSITPSKHPELDEEYSRLEKRKKNIHKEYTKLIKKNSRLKNNSAAKQKNEKHLTKKHHEFKTIA